MTKRTRNTYAPDFKAAAVERIRNGESYSAVSTDIGVHDSNLRTWVKEARKSKRGRPPKNGRVEQVLNRASEELQTGDFEARTGDFSFGFTAGSAIRSIHETSAALLVRAAADSLTIADVAAYVSRVEVALSTLKAE
jgi:transposase